jgi:hypothetical protein
MDNLRDFARRARRPIVGAPSYPAVNLPSLESMEILVTDSPASQREDRTVLDRADIPVHALNARSEVVLTGERPEHRYEVAMVHTGWFRELRVRVVLHGTTRHLVQRRTRADLTVKRIWLSRNYLYGDSMRTCFAVSRPPGQFEGRIWLATVPSGEDQIAEISERSFDYGGAPGGRVEFDLHDQYSYVLDWRLQRDRRGRDYRTQWYKGNELIDETIESSFSMREAEAAGCRAVRFGAYCDTDAI